MESTRKKVLLIDLKDIRQDTRVRMLAAAGYNVSVCADYVEAEKLNNAPQFDLIVIALTADNLGKAAAYSERLRTKNPTLPILLLTDQGVFVPRGTLSPRITTVVPEDVMSEIAEMLAGSKHIRELENQ